MAEALRKTAAQTSRPRARISKPLPAMVVDRPPRAQAGRLRAVPVAPVGRLRVVRVDRLVVRLAVRLRAALADLPLRAAPVGLPRLAAAGKAPRRRRF